MTPPTEAVEAVESAQPASREPLAAPAPSSLPPPATALRWRRPLVLFVATCLAVFLQGAMMEYPREEPLSMLGLFRHIDRGWTLAVPLLAILVTHELGHYVAARLHRVPASLPHFIPLPPLVFGSSAVPLSPFGTLGAVIGMPARIRSRNALLDIGAAGPLAGMVVAIPVLVLGLSQSEVRPIEGHGFMEGQCLLYHLLKQLVLGEIPAGHDVYLTSTAFAGWAGLLVTALNLLPIGQLDGGHIAYALLGPRQDRVARLLLWALPAVFLYNLAIYREIAPGMVWMVWFALLSLMNRLSGINHPPTEPGELSPARRAVAIGSLVLFVLLFMPTPMRAY